MGGETVDAREIGITAATIFGTAGAATMQNSLASQFAIIAVGALGGAMFRVLDAAPMTWFSALRHAGVGFLPAAALAGPMVYAAQKYLTAYGYDVPAVFLLGAVSFTMAAPMELLRRLQPVADAWRRLRRGSP